MRLRSYCVTLLILALITFGYTFETETLAIFKFNSNLSDSTFQDFSTALEKELRLEMGNSGFRIIHYKIEFKDAFKIDSIKSENSRLALFGNFEELRNGKKIFNFKILDMKTRIKEEKSIPVNFMEYEDLSQIIILKTRNFITNSVLGNLKISSKPLGCNIFLNQKNVGITPKEFFLKSGKYNINIEKKDLYSHSYHIEMKPGKLATINSKMEFKGYNTKYWILGAAIATWQAALFYALERNFRDNYLSLPLNSEHYKDNYNSYNRTKNIRFGLTSVAGISWISTLYCYFSNKTKKNKIFNK